MEDKTVLLITSPSGDGAERITILYGKLLEEAGYQIKLLLLKLPSMDNTSLLSFIPENWYYSLKEARLRYQIFNIFSYVRKNKPAIVFCSLGHISILLLLLKWLRLIKCKLVIRDCNMPSRHSLKQIKLSRWLFPKADVLLAQTNEMKEEMCSLYHLSENRIHVINNPIDKTLILRNLCESAELGKGEVKFIACGRISAQKDWITMLNAFCLVKDRIANPHLYIIGKEGDDNRYVAQVRSFVEDHELKDMITFLGYQSNPFKYLIQADCFVLSSIYEGLPNAMLEAMYLARPVAATKCIPYISQVIKDGINGYLCEVGDYKSLAECMVLAASIKGLPLYNDVNKSESDIINVFRQLSA